MKKKILVDLDVITVAKWDKGEQGDTARSFVSKVERGDFEMVTPYSLLDMVAQWEHETLKNQILEFYEVYSSKILSAKEIVDKSQELGVDYDNVIDALTKADVKEEDAILVFVASAFRLACLVTYNRIHLKSKEAEINHVLKTSRMEEISIVSPKSF